MKKELLTSDLPAFEDMDGVFEAFYREGFESAGGFLSKIKSAARSTGLTIFAPMGLDDLRPPKGYFGVHSVAVASEETYGFNRNGDAFPRAVLSSNHPSFVKYGSIYLEHAHRNTDEKLGHIVASAFNPAMDRVELFSWIKDAAKNRRGQSLRELAREGKAIDFSMSAAMPWDECSICHNKAKKPKDYCTDLRNNMKRFVKAAGAYAYARNSSPATRFFDNSVVEVPAEPTAKAMRYLLPGSDDMIKAASFAAQPMTLSAERADRSGIIVPDSYSPDEDALGEFLDALAVQDMHKLAAVERDIEAGVVPQEKARFSEGFMRVSDQLSAGTCRSADAGRLLPMLRKKAVLLPLHSFTALLSGASEEEIAQLGVVKEAACCMDSLFSDLRGLLAEISVPKRLALSVVEPACQEDTVNEAMGEIADKFSSKFEFVTKRAALLVASAPAKPAGEPARLSELSEPARALAGIYGLYKLAALRDLRRHMGEQDALLLCVSHNRQQRR